MWLSFSTRPRDCAPRDRRAVTSPIYMLLFPRGSRPEGRPGVTTAPCAGRRCRSSRRRASCRPELDAGELRGTRWPVCSVGTSNRVGREPDVADVLSARSSARCAPDIPSCRAEAEEASRPSTEAHSQGGAVTQRRPASCSRGNPRLPRAPGGLSSWAAFPTHVFENARTATHPGLRRTW